MGKLGTLSERPGLGFVASLSTSRKRRKPRPGGSTSWYHVRQRINQRKILEIASSSVKRPPLPTQEEYYAEYLRNTKEQLKVHRVRHRSIRVRREYRDRQRGADEFDRIVQLLRVEFKRLICKNQCCRDYFQHNYDTSVKAMMQQISLVSKGREVVKRRYRNWTMSGENRFWFSGQPCIYHKEAFHRIRCHDSKPIVAPKTRVRRDLESAVDDELHDVGEQFDWDSHKLTKLPSLHTPSARILRLVGGQLVYD